MKNFSLLGAASLQWYTLASLGVISPVFSKVISQGHDYQNYTTILLVTFVLGFVLRPLGAWILGAFANKYGRRRILIAMSFLFALFSVLLGCLPNSPVYFHFTLTSFFILALLQAFIATSITPLTAAYLYEDAEEDKQYHACWAGYAGIIGSFLALAVGVLVYGVFSHQQMMAFAWRIPLLLGAVLFVFAFLMMAKLKEPELNEHLDDLSKSDNRVLYHLIKIFFFSALAATGGELIGNMKQFLTQGVSIPFTHALWMVFAASLVLVVVAPLILKLIKTYGALTIALVSSLAMLLFSSLLYSRITSDNLVMTMACIMILTVIFAFFTLSLPGLFASLFGRNARAILPGVAFGFALGVFGGTVPLQSTYWFNAISNQELTIFLLSVSAFVSLIAGFFLTPKNQCASIK